MKKTLSTMLILAIMVTLVACSSKADLPKALSKEGIAPYELTDSEKHILQSFNMHDTSQIISFNSPKEAITLNVNVYRLEDGETWSKLGNGGISIGVEREPIDKLTGTFTMQLKENCAIDYSINANGFASYHKTDEITLDTDNMASVKEFLLKFQNITINTEIPIALIVYDSGTSTTSYSLQDYFEPSKFQGMDLVQVVTLEFSDAELN